MKRRTSHVGFGPLLLLLASVAAAVLPPGTAVPTKREQDLSNAKLARLKANVALMPIPINDAIDTFTKTVTKTINCPVGTTVTIVTIKVTTQLVNWDPTVVESGSAATHHWNIEDTVSGQTKTVICTNWVMIDPDVASADEASGLLGQIIDEGLLYHELLHCQLVINAMANDSDWQEKLCDCNFDLSAADPDHTLINPAVDEYINARMKGQRSIKVVTPPAQNADSDGRFDVKVDFPKKKHFQYDFSVPSDGNIDPRSVTVSFSGGTYHVRGKLRDKTKPGKLYVRIDPP